MRNPPIDGSFKVRRPLTAPTGTAVPTQADTADVAKSDKQAVDAYTRTPFGTESAGTAHVPTSPTASLKLPRLVAVGAVSAASLQDAVRTRAALVRPFALMADEAKKRGLEVFVLGGGATSFGAHVKAGLLAEAGDPRFRTDWVLSNELSAFLNLATQDLDIVIARSDGKPEGHQIEDFQTFVDEKLGSVEVDVRGLRTAKDDIHFPLTTGSPFFDEHHNNLDFLALHLTASGKESPLVDLQALQGQARTPVSAVDDLAAGSVRLLLSSRHDQTPTGKTGNSPPVKHAFRALIKAVRHSLVPDPASRTEMRRIFASWDGHIDTNEVVGRWMHTNLKKLAVDAMDLPAAFKLLQDVGALDKLRAVDDPDISGLFNRRPFVTEEGERATGQSAQSLGIAKLWHLTNDYDAFVSMTRTPLWRPNFLSSTGEKGDTTVAKYGAGVYFTQAGQAWGEASGARKTGYLVEVKLDENAQEGPDFKQVTSDSGQIFIVVTNRNVLTLDQQPLHKIDLDNALKMFFSPSTATRLHVLEQLTERLLVLAVDPKVAATIHARLLDQAKSCTAEEISSFVPILADERVRALAPDVVAVLIDRALDRKDVVTALELLQTPSNEQTVRAFATRVQPLVDDFGGIFIHTFGARLFGMFASCPDALAPIVKACGDARTLVSHGLAHGDPIFGPLLIELAAGLDAADRRMIRGGDADNLALPGFAPLAAALAS